MTCSAAFSDNVVSNNAVTCAVGASCEGGAVAIDGGSSSFDGDKFSGNTGERGATADLYVAATSATGR